MAFNINDIRSQLTHGGARQNLFQVQITNKGNGAADLKAPFLIQAASLPASNLGTIQVPYFGRFIKLAGDRVYDPWVVTVINDEDFLVRNALEEWSNKINRFEGNIRDLKNYKSQAQVTQYAKTGEILRVYEFDGLYPSTISQIDLGWDINDSIELFQVEFQYDLWRVVGGKTGNAGGD
jgi:hypothetical protein